MKYSHFFIRFAPQNAYPGRTQNYFWAYNCTQSPGKWTQNDEREQEYYIDIQ